MSKKHAALRIFSRRTKPCVVHHVYFRNIVSQTRRTVAAIRSCVSVCVENFDQDWGHVETAKIFLSSTSITVQNLAAGRRTVWAHVRGQKNWGCWSPHSLGTGIMPEPVEIHPPPYITYQIWSNGMGVGRGSQKYGGMLRPCPLEIGGVTRRNTPLPPVLPC